MQFVNARVFRGNRFEYGSFCVRNGRFAAEAESGETVVDLQGARVIPGLVDVHIHGAMGADFSDGDLPGLTAMAAHLARCGVTSFAPASMTLPYETLRRAYETAKQFREHRDGRAARLMGIHMEGPFLSERKKGAQNAAFLQMPDADAFFALQEACGGLIRIADVAPEVPGAPEFIRAAASSCTISAAHTDADYGEMAQAIEAGLSHVTHLFNCMPSIHHRAPGVIGAASERDHVTAELVCDGKHVHPSAVRMAFRLFPDRICLISDALRCCGLEAGTYELGGQTVQVADGLARLPDGTIAGSAADLFSGLQNAIAFGIPEAEAIRAATINPARVLGCDREVGSIEPGKLADFVVCDETMNRLAVYLSGEKVE